MTEADLFADALDIEDPHARADWLAAACGDDENLLQRVQRLLTLHDKDRGFLEQPTPDPMFEPTMEFAQPAADTGMSGVEPAPRRHIEAVTQVTSSCNFPSFPGYEVERQIGKGGMGIVLKGRDRKLNRIVAIKVLAPQLAADDEAVKRFLREAQTAAAVRHENVVTIYSVDDNPQNPFIVMECIDGESLQDCVKRVGTLPPRRAAEIARQTALGLAAAHAKGLVHRDVKPANVLLEENATTCVKLTDFGLARVTDDVSLTRSGYLAGTPQFMSPEQANGLVVDHRTDLFSLGSVLFVMLTGRPPFVAPSTAATLRLIVDHEPERVERATDAESACLWLIVDKLLKKSVDERFQSAQEVVHVLTQFLNVDFAAIRNELSVAPKPQKSQAVVRWAVLAVLLVGAAIWFGVTQSNREQTIADHSESTTTKTESTDLAQLEPSTSEPVEPTVPKVAEKPELNHPSASPESAVLPQVERPKRHPIMSDEYVWTSAENLGESINGPQSEDHACISTDGLTLIFARRGTRRSDLWMSQRGALNEPFPPAAPLPDGINTEAGEMDPFLTADGLTLYFTSDRPGGIGGTDIYAAQRPSMDAAFDVPTLVPAPINTADIESSPSLSDDGLHFWFGRSGRPRYIFEATRATTDAAFEAPRVLAEINRFVWHEFPRPLSDGKSLIVVVAKQDLDQRIYGTMRSADDSPYDELIDLGPEVNDWFGAISGPSWCEAESALYFSSLRPGGKGQRDLWRSVRRLKSALTGAQTEVAISAAPNAPPLAKAPFNAETASIHQLQWAEHLKTKPEIENSIGMKLKLIPPGEFLMGAAQDDPDAQPSEKPQHNVRLTQPYFMSATEVTIGDFGKFVSATKYVTVAEADQLGAFEIQPKARKPALVWNKLPNANTDDCPVRCVGWQDAMAFCDWLSKEEGVEYRLPTDAEWEFACRAGTTSRYSFGNNVDGSSANFADASMPARNVMSVRRFAPNAFGLFDMHGNVNEICWDGGRVYSSESVVDPIGSLDVTVPAVVRSGAASSSFSRLRSSHRYLSDGRLHPKTVFATHVKGFRVVRLLRAKNEMR